MAEYLLLAIHSGCAVCNVEAGKIKSDHLGDSRSHLQQINQFSQKSATQHFCLHLIFFCTISEETYSLVAFVTSGTAILYDLIDV